MKNKLATILMLLTLVSSMLMIAVPIVTVKADPEGYCLTFDGDSDYVEVPDSASLDITGAITVEAWIKPYTVVAADNWRAVVYKQRDSGPKGGYGLFVTEDQTEIYFFTYGKGVAFVSAGLTLDGWNHVVGIFDIIEGLANDEMKIYINGELKESFVAEGYSPYAIDLPLYLGGNPNDAISTFAPREFCGKIEEIRIYNKAITADEVIAHYNGGAGQYGEPETGLVAGYHLDEGTGTTTSDYSGQENHGSVVGATWQESTIALSVTYVHDVGVKSITVTPDMVEPGDMVHICVTVKNFGNATETFTLTTNYGIYAKIESIKDLAPGNELTFCYDWDTTGESTCYHTIDALASPVPGETNIRNNFRSTGVRIVSFIPPSATLKVEPSPAKGLVRGYFEVNVTISNLDVYWDMAGFDIKLCYNTTMLNATEVRLGDFATRFNLTWEIVKEINDPEGYAYLSCMWDIAHLTPETRPHPYGNGTLFTIRFLVTAEGQGNLTFEFPSVAALAAFPNATKWCTVEETSEPIKCITEDGTVNTMLPWKEDINADGKINILDIVRACISYASRPGDPNWNPYADLNGDNVINILDIVSITRVYGLKYDC